MGNSAIAHRTWHLVVVFVDAVHPKVQDGSDAGQSEGRFRHVGGDDHLPQQRGTGVTSAP